MKVKYSPSKWNPYAQIDAKPDTEIKVQDANTLVIDGEVFEFDPESVAWEDLNEQTDGRILEAHRTDGELYVTVRRFYTGSCAELDTGDYHEVEP